MSTPRSIFAPETTARLRQFGREFNAALREGFEEIGRAMKQSKPPASEDVQLARREAESVRRYERHVARERAIGLAFVRGKAARVRRELGL